MVLLSLSFCYILWDCVERCALTICHPVDREELRAKFVKAETALFRVRYNDEDAKDRQAFLSSQRFGGERVSDEDKNILKPQLMAATPNLKSDAEFEAETFYRVRRLHLHSLPVCVFLVLYLS